MIKKFLLLPFLLLLQTISCFATFHLDKSTKHSVCIVLPAYNEEDRIERTLEAYAEYFRKTPHINLTLLVVANNCSDNTVPVCKQAAKKYKEIQIINLIPGGKGFAVKKGFEKALQSKYDLIGFVDADLAFTPDLFYGLIEASDGYDGAIVSKYCKGSRNDGEQTFWGNLTRQISGRLLNWIVRTRFKFSFSGTQAGAKIFTYDTVQAVTPDMYEKNWYFDIELLYLCTINGKKIQEIPAVWKDQPGSKFQLNLKQLKEMFSGQGKVLKRHAKKANKYFANKRAAKKTSRKNAAAERKLQKKAAKKARILKRATGSKKKRSARYLI